jgi:sterol desaturase/sphingolipid hydroxylase (fatty acid hydroxylase superfamily)
MYPDIIALGIPIMIGCVVVEFLHDLRQKVRNFRVNGMLSNISCGILEQATGFISKGLFIALYAWLYEHFRLATIQDRWWVFLVLIVLIDLVFYFFHRFSHRCAFLWAGHQVHHEVEEFNLTVALRRSVMQEFTIIWVYLPFALFGFSPGAFFLMFAAHNLYQFLIHTSYLPELRIFGLVFNTPHHHELHHCRNTCYIDKNFAGVFIFWDKLFGTFAVHTEKPVFGVEQLTTTLNPVTAQVTTLQMVFAEAGRRQGWRAKLGAVFGVPDYLGSHGYDKVHRPKFDPAIPGWLLGLAIALFALLVFGTTAYRNYEDAFDLAQKIAVLGGIAAVLFLIGNLLDARGLPLLQRLRRAVE